MSVLPIITGADTPVLRKRTALVPKVTKEIKKLIKDMKDTLRGAKGAGLAATQVNQSLRLCLSTIDEKLVVLINPKILTMKKEYSLDEEGCLSLPGLWIPVPRSTEIVLAYQDEKGKKHERKLHNFNARVVQHELDHLDGVLIVDYLPPGFVAKTTILSNVSPA